MPELYNYFTVQIGKMTIAEVDVSSRTQNLVANVHMLNNKLAVSV